MTYVRFGFRTTSQKYDGPHNLKVVGSNPTPATKKTEFSNSYSRPPGQHFRFGCPWKHCGSKFWLDSAKT